MNDFCLLRSAHLCVDIDLDRYLRFDFFSFLIIEGNIVGLDRVGTALFLQCSDHLEELFRISHLFDFHRDFCVKGLFVRNYCDLFSAESDRSIIIFLFSCHLLRSFF